MPAAQEFRSLVWSFGLEGLGLQAVLGFRVLGRFCMPWDPWPGSLGRSVVIDLGCGRWWSGAEMVFELPQSLGIQLPQPNSGTLMPSSLPASSVRSALHRMRSWC